MSSLCSAFTPVIPRRSIAFYDSTGRISLAQDAQELSRLSSQLHPTTCVALCIPDRAAYAISERASTKVLNGDARHALCEQKRRKRINEKLSILRELVPGAQGLTTAALLDECVAHVEKLKAAILQQEKETVKGITMPQSHEIPPAQYFGKLCGSTLEAATSLV